MVQSIHQTQGSLANQMPMSISKEHVWSIKNLGHIQIIQFADETHLTHQKATQVTQIVRVIRPTFNPNAEVLVEFCQ